MCNGKLQRADAVTGNERRQTVADFGKRAQLLLRWQRNVAYATSY